MVRIGLFCSQTLHLWEQDRKIYQENAATNNAKENIAQKTTQAKKQPEALIQCSQIMNVLNVKL